MKRGTLLSLLAIAMMTILAACAGVNDDAAQPDPVDAPETSVVRWNWGTSGNVLITIAEERGYLAEYGITIENVAATAIADAMTLLTSGQVDIVSNSGTAGPLQRIASGIDLVSFGGHMVTGAMPVIVRTDSEFVNATGIEDIIGTRFAARPSFFAFTGAIMELGYDPFEVVEWIIHPTYPDAFAALLQGEVDFALMGTGQNYLVQNTPEVTVVAWHSSIMPYYSCCRLVAQRSFVEENPTTIRLLMQALIRAQLWFDNNREESVAILANRMNVPESFVASFMTNPRYHLSLDPLRDQVIYAWNILEETGFLDEEAMNINILNHINTELFYEALTQATARYGYQDPAWFDAQWDFFNQQNYSRFVD